jgi:hypothetical protein
MMLNTTINFILLSKLTMKNIITKLAVAKQQVATEKNAKA